jgi:hypothetical protein
LSDERLYYYSAIRYVPRPLAEEFVNVGVVAVSDAGDEVSVEFTDDWTRARAFGGNEEDILMLQRLARAWSSLAEDSPLSDVAEGGGLTWLDRVYDVSANSVQFSAPHRAFASNVDEIMDEIYYSLIGSAPRPLIRRPATRKRSTGTKKRSTGTKKRTTGTKKRSTGRKRSTTARKRSTGAK